MAISDNKQLYYRLLYFCFKTIYINPLKINLHLLSASKWVTDDCP